MNSRRLLISSILFLVLTMTLPARAAGGGWSFNLGYNNPPGATVGVNFMKLWSNLAFEFGIGWLDLSSSSSSDNSSNNNTSSLSIAGDLNLKYLFGSGGVRPYIQGGFGVGSVA